MRRVAVIGAGPSGLAAAKYLLQYGFIPQIFDKCSSVGGMWNPESSRCWASMRTNLSSYCCAFSDLQNEPPNLFPSQKEIHNYLVRYSTHFLKPDYFSFNCEVKNVNPNKEGEWVVHWKNFDGVMKSKQFHSVVVACGFFGSPYIPQIPNLARFNGQVLHSDNYSNSKNFQSKTVAVVGCSHNAAEVSADIASRSATVINIAPRRVWVVPRMLPLKPASPSSAFAPLDLVFYRRSGRATQTPGEIFGDSTKHRQTNNYFRSIVGKLPYCPTEEGDSSSPFVAISDYYHQMVASQRITTVLGRILGIGADGSIVVDNEQKFNADALVFCTGYRTALPFFSSDILDFLSFDEKEAFMPLLLHRSMIHPQFPGLAFVGMYRGPYFAVIELQAHWIAALFAGALTPPSEQAQLEGIQLERNLKMQRPRPQFSHPDYIGLADKLAADLGILSTEAHQDFVIPASYCSDPQIKDSAIVGVEKAWTLFSEAGKGIGLVILQSMFGTWNLFRTLTSRNSAPSGTVSGTAEVKFYDGATDSLLYRENGYLTLDSGSQISIGREDVYVFNALQDSLDVFFASEGKKCGHFLTLHFTSSEHGWSATSTHTCVKDTYEAKYTFGFTGIHLTRWEMSFKVSGPAKNYDAVTVFTRPSHIFSAM